VGNGFLEPNAIERNVIRLGLVEFFQAAKLDNTDLFSPWIYRIHPSNRNGALVPSFGEKRNGIGVGAKRKGRALWWG